MGNLPSTIAVFYNAILDLKRTYDTLQARLEVSPGLPNPSPTQSLWTYPPSSVSSDAAAFLKSADVVIIGSGITGTSVAYNLLREQPNLKVVMLEARDICSGATGRNGGHVNPPLYHDFEDLRERHGEQNARMLIRFRLAHLQEMKRIATEEDILKESQCREVEHLDVFLSEEPFIAAKDKLAKWRGAMPLEATAFGTLDRDEAIGHYHLGEDTVGCIYNPGGAIHPYRFVTTLLGKLFDRHHNFYLATNTACTYIAGPDESSNYTVHTPRGLISTSHVIHATNGWCSHLLPAFRRKVLSARGAMSAQRPGRSLHPSTLSGWRSFVFYRGGTGYDYLTQLPTGEHELMLGGGWAQATADRLPDIGMADDSVLNFEAQTHLAGALPQYFGLRNWGKEAEPEPGSSEEEGLWAEGRTKAQWSGILGISVDLLPWVGRIPTKISGRAQPRRPVGSAETSSSKDKIPGTAAPGEWLSAGYSGEGMVHAWMSGKALAYMVLDRDTEIQSWFPDILRVTEERWKKASVDELLARFV